MSYPDAVYCLGFLSGTVFGTTIGMLFTAWWLHRTWLPKVRGRAWNAGGGDDGPTADPRANAR